MSMLSLISSVWSLYNIASVHFAFSNWSWELIDVIIKFNVDCLIYFNSYIMAIYYWTSATMVIGEE